MNIHEAIKDLNAVKDESMDGVVLELETRFGSLPNTLKSLICIKPDHYTTNKTDPLIKLNKTGLLNFGYNYDYDMLGNGMIPLFDMFDANYIVYRVRENDYCVFSVISEMPLSITNDIFELIAEYF